MTDTLDELVEMARQAFAHPFSGAVKIELEEGGGLWIDGNKTPPSVSKKEPKSGETGCIWRSNLDTMKRVLEGERALESAFISGRLTIIGDMSVMARLALENST